VLHVRPHNIIAFASAILWSAAALAAPGVSVEPAATAVTVGEEFDLSVVANSELPDLSCYAVTIAYDPLHLELVSAVEGDLFALAGLPTFFSHETNGNDDAWTNCVLGFGTSVPAPGELVRLRFRALQDGISPVTLTEVILRDVDRVAVTGLELTSAQVTAGATATPPGVLAGALRMTAVPNPSSGPVRLGLELDQAKAEGLFGVDPRELLREGSVVLCDLAGRRIRELPGIQPRWDGRDAQGRRVASGSYLAVFEHPATLRVVTKLVRFE